MFQIDFYLNFYFVRFYENLGNNQFVENNLLISGVTFPNYCRPTFSDIDNDGDLDLIMGKIDGTLIYYENKGTKFSPLWVINDTIFKGIKVKQNSHPGFADLDGDGRKDLVIGEYDGNFTFFKNLFAIPTSVVKEKDFTLGFNLEQNYPNPFNTRTKIRFSIPNLDHKMNGKIEDFLDEINSYHKINFREKLNSTNDFSNSNNVTIKIFDVLGRELAVLLDQKMESGTYEIEFDAKNLPSGVYTYQLRFSNYKQTKKMILLK